jgi:putative phage-type endonuclease
MAAPPVGLSERQQDIRRTGIGASEVAKVVGLVPGAIEVWAEKVGQAEPFEGNSLTEFGSRIERVIGEAWQERHAGVRIYSPGTLRHPTRPWALATPDRVVAPPGLGRPARESWQQLLEIKVAFFSGGDYGEAGTDEVPERHLVQVAWQLAVTGLERATLVALVNGDYREFPLTRDPELEGMLLEQVGAWWQAHVVAGVPPPPDSSAAYADYLRRRHPVELQPPLDATPELLDLIEKVRDFRARAKAADDAKKGVEAALKSVLGDAAGVAGLCTWKANRPSRDTDWEAAAAELLSQSGMNQPEREEFLRRFTTTKAGARVLRLTKER